MFEKSDDVELLGGKFRVRRKGRGSPLLFLHGMGGVTTWLPFFDALAEKFEVIVPDHPGFGGSDTPPWLRNMGDMAYFYLDFFEKLEIRGAAVIGSSLGAWIAAEVAIRDPRVFGPMVLIAPAGLRVKGHQSGDVFIWTQEEQARNLYFDQRISEKMIAVAPTPESLETRLKNSYMSARLAWEPRFFNPDLNRWVHRIGSPVHIIWGEDDKILPAAFIQPWLDELRNVTSRIIPACGHLPHIEKADECLESILPFLMVSSS